MVFNLIHSALRMCLFCPVLPKRERTKLTASSVFFFFIGIETKDYRYYDPVAPFVYLFSFFKKGNLLSIPASYTAKKEDLVLLDPFYAMTLLLLVEPLMMLQNLIRHPLLTLKKIHHRMVLADPFFLPWHLSFWFLSRAYARFLFSWCWSISTSAWSHSLDRSKLECVKKKQNADGNGSRGLEPWKVRGLWPRSTVLRWFQSFNKEIPENARQSTKECIRHKLGPRHLHVGVELIKGESMWVVLSSLLHIIIKKEYIGGR